MATKLTTPIKRVIRVHGVESDVLLTLDEEGVSMQIPGTKMKSSLDWLGVAQRLRTPFNVPSYLAGKPVELLQHMAAKKAKKKGGAL